MALTDNSLYKCFNDIAKTETKEKVNFYDTQEDCHQPNAKMKFITCSSCQKHIALKNRTRGFFKTEWSGTEMICLNSNTYCAFNERKKMKMDSGGSKKTLDLSLERFKSVLYGKEPEEGSNRCFCYYKEKKCLIISKTKCQ